ncbi:MAG: hypothetical protein AAGE18_09160 [Pseudomonadota bacterium]
MRGFATLLALAGLLLASPLARAESAALQAQITEVHAAVAPYRDVAAARAAGWRRTTAHVPLMGEHWSKRRAEPDYVDGQPIDFTQPSNLIYAEIGGRRELVAVAYVVRIGPNDPLPEGFQGAEDLWHVHNLDQILAAVGEVRPFVARLGRSWVDRRLASDGRRRLAMLHVWLDGRNPLGRFENLDPTLPYRRHGLGPAHWSGASLDAARGVALALPEGCEEEFDGKLRLAGVERRRKRQILALCRDYAAQVRGQISAPPATLNRVAEEAARTLDSHLLILLRPAETARIAALVEGPSGICMAR